LVTSNEDRAIVFEAADGSLEDNLDVDREEKEEAVDKEGEVDQRSNELVALEAAETVVEGPEVFR
jgi:hypothetical protein